MTESNITITPDAPATSAHSRPPGAPWYVVWLTIAVAVVSAVVVASVFSNDVSADIAKLQLPVPAVTVTVTPPTPTPSPSRSGHVIGWTATGPHYAAASDATSLTPRVGGMSDATFVVITVVGPGSCRITVDGVTADNESTQATDVLISCTWALSPITTQVT